MKRYFVFAYDGYYPAGGMGDFQCAHDTLEEARKALGSIGFYDYGEIWDMETIEEVG